MNSIGVITTLAAASAVFVKNLRLVFTLLKVKNRSAIIKVKGGQQCWSITVPVKVRSLNGPANEHATSRKQKKTLSKDFFVNDV